MREIPDAGLPAQAGPRTLKAWITHGYRDMRLEEVADPEPSPGWVKLRILVAQPSVTEVMLFRGERTYGHERIARALAAGPVALFGHEFSGEVVALGEGVESLRVGDRVAARGSHPDGIVGFDYPGAFAEYGVFPESLFAVLPNNIDDSEGAAIQPLTDAVAAVHAARIRLGDRVAVIGLGSIGLGIMQAALAGGAGKVVAVARRDEVLELARHLGADVAVNSAHENSAEAVRRLTGGSGADIVFDAAGGVDTLAQAGGMARDEGLVVSVAFGGEGALLPFVAYRPRGLRFAFPSLLDRRLFELSVSLVATGRVTLKPMIRCILDGIEHLPKAFEKTGAKSAYGLINPAQVRIAS